MPYVHLPGAVRVEAAQRDVDLVARAVHVIHHSARHFGKHLLGIFLSVIDRHIGHLNDRIAASGGDAGAVNGGQTLH